jgi:hypothetical protein
MHSTSSSSSAVHIDRAETTPVYRYRPPPSPLPAQLDDRQRGCYSSSLRNFTYEERQFPCQARPRRPHSPQVRSVSRRSYCAPRTVPPLPPQPPPLDGCVPMVEIEPGVALPVRSAKETQLAIRDGFYKSLVCLYCTSSIGCILDADFVICPDCLCVNAATSPNSAEPPRTSGGVGLGFRL